MNVRRKLFRFRGIQCERKLRLNGSKKRFRRPSVGEEEIFEASLLAALTQNIAGAEYFGDGTNHGNDLVVLNEGVQANGEMRFGGKSAGDAK